MIGDLMRALAGLWAAEIGRRAGPPLRFAGPHCGVHVRRWRIAGGWTAPQISLECDPGYAGIGAAMTPVEARKLGLALIRAADCAEEPITREETDAFLASERAVIDPMNNAAYKRIASTIL